jgi:hypothetical protein
LLSISVAKVPVKTEHDISMVYQLPGAGIGSIFLLLVQMSELTVEK